MMDTAAQVVAAMVEEDIGRSGPGAEVEPEVPNNTAEAAAQEAHTAASTEEIPDPLAEPELPEDIQYLLEDEDEDEVEETTEETYQPVAPTDGDEYVDPEVAHLRAELKKARKEAEHNKKLRMKAERAKWEKEAEKYFPFADPSSITADSRRAFIRQAKEQHDRMKTNPRIQAAIEQERKRARAEAEQAWGKPTTGPGTPPPESRVNNAELEAARRSGRLEKVVATMFRQAGME